MLQSQRRSIKKFGLQQPCHPSYCSCTYSVLPLSERGCNITVEVIILLRNGAPRYGGVLQRPATQRNALPVIGCHVAVDVVAEIIRMATRTATHTYV